MPAAVAAAKDQVSENQPRVSSCRFGVSSFTLSIL